MIRKAIVILCASCAMALAGCSTASSGLSGVYAGEKHVRIEAPTKRHLQAKAKLEFTSATECKYTEDGVTGTGSYNDSPGTYEVKGDQVIVTVTNSEGANVLDFTKDGDKLYTPEKSNGVDFESITLQKSQ